MLFSAAGCVVRHENENERWSVITAYKLATLEILSDMFVLAYKNKKHSKYNKM